MTGREGDAARPRRALRADAQRNEDRLLEAAAVAFAREGAGASVKDIARAAGVGVGTLYRRFPSKELLIEAVYRQEVQRLCEAAPHLTAAQPPVDALRTWMERFIDFMAAKQGMADALSVVLTDDSEKLHTRALLADAITHLLTALEGQAVARPGVDPQDVLMALGGISLMAASEERRDLATRLIDLLLHGIVTN
ncbi:TetR family transcriptional regulator [Streptomyces sp. Ru62]|uniref:TetR/AcrR family transcriptional regulator n=1 Tax=Streptomyces sp. Ru62 TaxID=2080745 RepID=UPI000CDD67FA|nr:TetR/AcrR family transcriptional regulator [Streptomyces sp. Ru62]POX63455.1 TetR family transcriptional regulator [Streptomyces sp. Ru62]